MTLTLLGSYVFMTQNKQQYLTADVSSEMLYIPGKTLQYPLTTSGATIGPAQIFRLYSIADSGSDDDSDNQVILQAYDGGYVTLTSYGVKEEQHASKFTLNSVGQNLIQFIAGDRRKPGLGLIGYLEYGPELPVQIGPFLMLDELFAVFFGSESSIQSSFNQILIAPA